MDDFVRRLSEESRLTAYPDEALDAAAQAVGMPASR
jgi:hypothetical protein